MEWRGATLLLLLHVLTGVSEASDVNWGQKVNCFVISGTVICPGCNSRAGLACPRELRNSPSCLPSTSPPVFRKRPTTPEVLETTESTTPQFNETIEDDDYNTINDDYNITTDDYNTTVELVLQTSTKAPLNMDRFRYRYFPMMYRALSTPWSNQYRRKRQVSSNLLESEICDWNGDCPCPLICCRTGEGCPKRCVKGIRLPPPFG